MLADALGLSAVQVNRSLRQSREMGMVTFQNGVVSLDDYVGLCAFAQFDPAFLDQLGQLLK
jgi:hypothetical protein